MENNMTEPPKSGKLYVTHLLTGGVINSEQMALDFARLVLKGLYGEEELLRQLPLRVSNEGETWLVEGSYQEPAKAPGALSWFIRVRKYDSLVENLGHRHPFEIPGDGGTDRTSGR